MLNYGHVHSLKDSSKWGCLVSLESFVDPFCSSRYRCNCAILYCWQFISNQKWRVCMQDKSSVLLLSQVGMAAAEWSLMSNCALDKSFKHMYIHVYAALAFLQPTRSRDQNENEWALQDFLAGWLETELLYLGTNHITHAVYFRKYWKCVTDFSGGFWCSEDTYLNGTANIAVKCKDPTQQKYPC